MSLKYNLPEIKTNLLSGLTVALAMVPEAIAFALIAQVSPLTGLYAAILVCFITSLFGGRPGMVSGATGALAVVMVSLVVQHGPEYLFFTVILMGILQIIFALFKLGKFIRMVPYPVMLGFVNGLAVVIFIAQFNHFKTINSDGIFVWMEGMPLYIMLGLISITVAIIYFLPRITKSIPSTLAAIIATTGLVAFFGIDSKTVGDLGSIAGGIPDFNIPLVPINFETFKITLPYALLLAAIGLIETLLTLNLIDDMTDTRGRPNKESMAQGFANIITGFFGGMGGCAMIGQSMINVNSGGRGRLSGISAALFLLLFILIASPLIEQIPLAALIGVMFIVVIGTFEWSSFRIIGKVPVSDALILITVSAVTVITDLAFAVIVGVIISALVFSWEHAKYIRIESREDHKGSTVYAVTGPLFFGSVASFLERFDPKMDNDDVVIDFARSRVADHSGLEAIDSLAERYENAGKKLHLVHLSQDCRRLLTRAGNLVEVNVIEDPKYFVAKDSVG